MYIARTLLFFDNRTSNPQHAIGLKCAALRLCRFAAIGYRTLFDKLTF